MVFAAKRALLSESRVATLMCAGDSDDPDQSLKSPVLHGCFSLQNDRGNKQALLVRIDLPHYSA